MTANAGDTGGGAAPRQAVVERRTGEVAVTVRLSLDGGGATSIDTGIPFLDHLLAQVGRHARFDLDVQARGDLHVDAHHTVEDAGIALGAALAEALGDKTGVRRFGDATVPLDEARARAAVDLSGRPYLVWEVAVPVVAGELREFDPLLARHLLEGVVANARCTIHVVLERADLAHHALEACFKALARALGEACAADPRAGMPSTKGVLG